jgi:integrase
VANRTLALLSKIFTFAVSRDILKAGPCVAIEKPSQEKERDRVLSEEEIKKVWTGLEGAGMLELTKLAFKLILVTGQRKGEVLSAEWSELNLDEGWWTIPGKKTKNGLTHRVPLSDLAFELLAQIKPLAENSKWLFPSPNKATHITERSLNKALDRNMDLIGNDPFGPHDLRRTMASHMTGMGISRLVVQKVLNHSEPGITRVYDRYGYDIEKRQALEAWGRKLESILTGKKGKVIPLSK